MHTPNPKHMTEQEFIFAWILAAKSASGIATPWRDSTIEFQIKEAKEIYKQITKA
jgi:hypothetical protein